METISHKLELGLRLEDEAINGTEIKNGSHSLTNSGRNLSSDVIDWSDEGEEDDDTPRNYDILSKLAEESEDEGDQDTLQFSRLLHIS